MFVIVFVIVIVVVIAIVFVYVSVVAVSQVLFSHHSEQMSQSVFDHSVVFDC